MFVLKTIAAIAFVLSGMGAVHFAYSIISLRLYTAFMTFGLLAVAAGAFSLAWLFVGPLLPPYVSWASLQLAASSLTVISAVVVIVGTRWVRERPLIGLAMDVMAFGIGLQAYAFYMDA